LIGRKEPVKNASRFTKWLTKPSSYRWLHPLVVRRTGFIWISVIAVLATTLYTLAELGTYYGGFVGFDSGIFDQAIQSYANFRIPDILLKSQEPFNILGDHFSPVLVLLTPFYWLWPNVRVLLVIQAVGTGIVAWLIGYLGVRWGLKLWQALIVEAGFALGVGVLNAITFDFHETVFGLPLLVLLCWGLLENRTVWVGVVSLLLCLTKEDMPFYIAGAALFWIFAGRKIAGLILGVASVLAEALLLFVVIPYFSYWGSYAYIGNGARGLRSTMDALTNFGEHLVSSRGIEFLVLIALTFGIGLTSKLVWVIVPTLLFRFSAADIVYLGFEYHYGILIAGIAACALIHGWTRMNGRTAVEEETNGSPIVSVSRLRSLSVIVTLAQIVLLAVLAFHGVRSTAILNRVSWLFDHPDTYEKSVAIADRIPTGAKVVADVYLVNYLVDRTPVTMAQPSWTDETGIPLVGDYVFLDTGTVDKGNLDTHWAQQKVDELQSSGQYEWVVGDAYDRGDRTGSLVLLKRIS
jgi:uncharacterized membrane protein